MGSTEQAGEGPAPEASISLMNLQSEWIKSMCGDGIAHASGTGRDAQTVYQQGLLRRSCWAINLVHSHKFAGSPLNIRIRLRNSNLPRESAKSSSSSHLLTLPIQSVPSSWRVHFKFNGIHSRRVATSCTINKNVLTRHKSG